jgi:hypothetical protein
MTINVKETNLCCLEQVGTIDINHMFPCVVCDKALDSLKKIF